MITISRAVREILHRSPFLTDTMVEGVANNAKIARKIKKEVEARLYEEVSVGAIVMALRRFESEFKRPQYGHRFLRSLGNISVQSHLVEFVFRNSPDLPKIEQMILKRAQNHQDLFLNISRGIRETIVVVSKGFEEEVGMILTHEKGLIRVEPLSAITLRLSEESLGVPGVYYPILKALAMEGVNFVEILSVNTELTILFEDRVIDEAFSILKRLTS